MRGIWNSAKWEFFASELPRLQSLYALGLWLLLSWNAARSWNGSGVPLLVSLHIIVFATLAVYRGLKWPFTGAFDLERTSGRPAWQSVTGRVLCWGGVLSVGALLQRSFLRMTLGTVRDLWPRMYLDGAERLERLEAWSSWRGALQAVGVCLGVYVVALTVALWYKSCKRFYLVTPAAAAAGTFGVCALIYIVFRWLPPGLLGLGCILVGLPVSSWLLARRAE